MKALFIILAISFMGPACVAQESDGISVITKEVYRELIEQDSVQLVDIRTPEEYAEGHISGAVNIDFYSEDFLESFDLFNKKRALFIYCRSGNRSAKASKKLSEAGFTIIRDLKGGYKAWSEREIEEK